MEELILGIMYPRIDENVSKTVNHLLKAPFCIHPGTGRVCIQVNPNQIYDLNPDKVPTLTQLLQEFQERECGVSNTSNE